MCATAPLQWKQLDMSNDKSITWIYFALNNLKQAHRREQWADFVWYITFFFKDMYQIQLIAGVWNIQWTVRCLYVKRCASQITRLHTKFICALYLVSFDHPCCSRVLWLRHFGSVQVKVLCTVSIYPWYTLDTNSLCMEYQASLDKFS